MARTGSSTWSSTGVFGFPPSFSGPYTELSDTGRGANTLVTRLPASPEPAPGCWPLSWSSECPAEWWAPEASYARFLLWSIACATVSSSPDPPITLPSLPVAQCPAHSQLSLSQHTEVFHATWISGVSSQSRDLWGAHSLWCCMCSSIYWAPLGQEQPRHWDPSSRLSGTLWNQLCLFPTSLYQHPSGPHLWLRKKMKKKVEKCLWEQTLHSHPQVMQTKTLRPPLWWRKPSLSELSAEARQRRATEQQQGKGVCTCPRPTYREMWGLQVSPHRQGLREKGRCLKLHSNSREVL